MIKEYQVTSTIAIEATSLKEAVKRVYQDNNVAFDLARNAEIEEIENE